MFLVLHFIILGQTRPRAPVVGGFSPRWEGHKKSSALFQKIVGTGKAIDKASRTR